MVEFARISDSSNIAKIHHSALVTGFLSRLGTSFLSSLYMHLINNEMVLVYREGEKILGFVSCSLNSRKMMRKFLFKPAGVSNFLRAILKNPSLILSAFETMRIPQKSKSASRIKAVNSLPETELLSISVCPDSQMNGIGSRLLAGLEERLRQEGVKEYKVVAGADLISANRFYQKNGFHLVTQINIHRRELSNVYCKSLL